MDRRQSVRDTVFKARTELLTFVLVSVKRILTSLEDVSELIIKSPVRTGRIVAKSWGLMRCGEPRQKVQNTNLELNVHPPVPIDIVQLRAERTNVSRQCQSSV